MPTLEELLAKSIPDVSQRFVDRGRPIPKGLVAALENDARQGAHHLAKLIRDRWRKNRAEGQRLHNLLRFEIDLWEQGFNLIAGVDEAGMAPLAGPVIAGAVILPKNYKLKRLNDSKQILDETVRGELAEQIKRDCIVWAVGCAEVEEIDTLNIYHAGLLAMRRAVEGLASQPDFVLVDARRIPHYSVPQRGIIKGDCLSASIAAASIIAKTTRDAIMSELDSIHPGYNFTTHKGYPTPEHCRRLQELGAAPIHRRSFARVRQALGLDPIQDSLFAEQSAPEEAIERADAASPGQ